MEDGLLDIFLVDGSVASALDDYLLILDLLLASKETIFVDELDAGAFAAPDGLLQPRGCAFWHEVALEVRWKHIGIYCLTLRLRQAGLHIILPEECLESLALEQDGFWRIHHREALLLVAIQEICAKVRAIRSGFFC